MPKKTKMKNKDSHKNQSKVFSCSLASEQINIKIITPI